MMIRYRQETTACTVASPAPEMGTSKTVSSWLDQLFIPL